MKILLLNPKIDAEHSIVQSLQNRGIGVLLPNDKQEALQLLQVHGTSIDLAVLHREGESENSYPGISVLDKIKADASQADLPILMTTSVWNETECAAHQESAVGANAYLKMPFSDNDFFSTIEAIIGELPGTLPFAPDGTSASHLILEESSDIYNAPRGDRSQTSITLELPTEFGDTTPNQPHDLESLLNAPAESSAAPVSLAPDPDVTSPSLQGSLPEPVQIQEAPPQQEEPEPDESELYREMPYLMQGSLKRTPPPPSPRSYESIAVGDAIVPGGAYHAPDVETLKKYLLLREQDVAALSSQLKQSRDQIRNLETSIEMEKATNAEYKHTLEEQKKRINRHEQEKTAHAENLQAEIRELQFQLKTRSDKVKLLELQLRDAIQETEKIKDRVRSDIRKIRVHEKELENRLEIMKKDAEALIGARETKITELKRKLDLLEFNMDILQEQYTREKEGAALIREKLMKASQVVKLAGGLLDHDTVDDAKTAA